MNYYLKDGIEQVRSFHKVTSGIPKLPALLNINALEKMENSHIIDLLNYSGQLKVKLPTENHCHVDVVV